MRDVVVTGVGVLTALGVGAEATWSGLVEGRSGIGPLEGFDASTLHTRIGAEISDFDPTAFAERRSLRLMTRNEQFATAAAKLAVADAGADLTTIDPLRTAAFLGGNKEISNPMKVADAILASRGPDGVATMARLATDGVKQFHPLFYVEGLQAGALFYVSEAFGMKGANAYFHGTADSGMTAIGRAFRAVRRGEADVAVAGGFDEAVSWWSMAKMDGLGVLSTRNDLGAEAFRPYDRDRSGSVLGEGAAVVVLETAEQAKARDANVYAKVVGFGGGNDAEGLLTPNPEGRGLVNAVRAALRDAGDDLGAIDYVATHGAATRLGDPSETLALRTALGAAADDVMASSIKPATGHLVAAAGALNVAVAALAVRHGVVPPTLNLTDPDRHCDLDWVPGSARETPVNGALALARGLEGQNVALALRAV
ncbi:MAG: beta-ketoacyl-[acyl-carrier-protein] synthase family protein [Egibacteraceae bacterium]